MTHVERSVLLAYAAIILVWPLRHAVVTIIFRLMDYLTPHSRQYAEPDPPLVSVLIPAKDEEAGLADCLATVQAQIYPNLEILVVDDRSTDRTGAIARAIAAHDPRVRVLTIEELPAGWTGKTHALHVAVGQTRGAWLWLIDADTRHAPESLSVVMQYAHEHGAVLASLLPEMRCETFWERVVQPLMGIVLMRSFPPFRVNRPDGRLGFANGQYILIRRDAYDAAGGHEAVRDRFVEDIYLAQNVKALGLPIRVAIGVGISTTRMYTTLPQLVRGWSRILYDALGRRVWPLAGKILEPLIISQTGTLALLVGGVLLALSRSTTFATWLLGLTVVHLVLQVTVLYRMYRLQSPSVAWAAVWYPLAGFVSDWILFVAIQMCLTGRVTWRGTSYAGAVANSADSPPPGDAAASAVPATAPDDSLRATP